MTIQWEKELIARMIPFKGKKIHRKEIASEIESTLGKRILDETIWNSKNGILAESNLWIQPVVIWLLIQENNQITSSSPSSGQIEK